MMDGDGRSRRIPYDKLVIGAGAAPVCPVATGVRPEKGKVIWKNPGPRC